MAVIANLVVKISANDTEFQKTTASLSKSWKRVGDQLQSIGSSLTTAITLPLAGIALGATKVAVDFETAMTKVRTLASESEANVKALREQVLALAPTVGIGPTALADALLVIESNGVRGSEAMDLLTMSAKASSIGMGGTTDIARALTAAVNAYGVENLSAAQAADILTATVDAGGAEAKELAGEIGRVVGVAAQLGVSFDQVGAFIATYTRLGLSAAEATTGLSGVLNMILNPSKEARQALAGIGMSAQQLRTEVKEKGLAESLIGLMDKVRGNGDAVGALFGNVRALAGVMGTAGAQAQTYRQILDQIQHSTGTLNDRFEIWRKTTAASWAEFQAQVQVVAITLGERLAPAFSGVLIAAAPLLEAVTKLVTWFGELPQPVQTFVIAVGGLAAVTGPVTYLTGNLVSAGGAFLKLVGYLPGGTSAIGSAKLALEGLGSMLAGLAGPLTLFAAAYAGMVAGIHSETFQHAALTGDGLIASSVRGIGNFGSKVNNLLSGNGWTGGVGDQLTEEQFRTRRDALNGKLPTMGPAVPTDQEVAIAQAKEQLDALTRSQQRPQQQQQIDAANLERITKLRQDLTGATKIQAAEEMLAALRGVDASTLLKDKQVEVYETMHAATELMGRKAPAAMKTWEQATLSAAVAAGKAGSKIEITSDDLAAMNRVIGPSAHYWAEMELEFAKVAETASKIPQALPGWINELPSAEESVANIGTVAGLTADELQRMSAIQPPAWWKQFTDPTGLSVMASTIGNLGRAVGGTFGEIADEASGFMQAFAQFKKNGADTSALGQVSAYGNAASAAWSVTQAGGGKASNALKGAAAGATAGMAAGPWGAAVGAGIGALTGFVKSRTVSKDEKEARSIYREFETQVLGTLSLAQQGEAMGERWRGALIGVRDAFQDIGLTEHDATDAMKRLNDATRIGSEAVRSEIERINVALQRSAQLHDALAQKQSAQADILKQAVERYGLSFANAGHGFQMGNLADRAEELIQSRDALLGSGASESTVLSAMGGDFSALAQDALSTGIELPTELKDSFAKLSGMGLLQDEHGQALSTSALAFGDELKPLFDSVLTKLDALITELQTPIAALKAGGFAAVDAHAAGDTADTGGGLTALPRFGAGGIVRRPTIGLIGEAGPEAVVPLNGNAMGGDTHHWHINAIDGPSIARLLDNPTFADKWRTMLRRDRNGMRSDMQTLLAT